MSQNRTITLLVIAIASGAFFLCRRLKMRERRAREKEASDYAEKGHRLVKEKAYSEAAVFYLKYLSIVDGDDVDIVNVYNGLTLCLIKIRAYKEALVYAERSLAMNVLSNEKALKWRYECHKVLDMKQEMLVDAFLCGLVTKEDKYRKLAQDILKMEAEVKARKRVGTNDASPSKISYDNVFCTFPGIVREELYVNDQLVKLIRSREYERAFEKTKGRGDSIPKFVAAVINHVRGKDLLAISLLEGEKMIFSICFREYLKSLHGQTPMDMEDFINKNNSNVSILLYVSRIHFNFRRVDLYEEFINMAMKAGEYDFLHVDRVLSTSSRGKAKETEELLEKAYEKHPKSISLLSVMCEYYFRNEDFARFERSLSEIEKWHAGDPRLYLFKGLLAQFKGELDEAERHFRTAIELDDRYFKPYVHLGGILLGRNDKSSRTIYEKALECAVTYDEIFAVEQAFILLDIQDKILGKYPDVLRVFS